MSTRMLKNSNGTTTIVRSLPIRTGEPHSRADASTNPRCDSLGPLRAMVEDHIDLVQAIKRYFVVQSLPREILVHILGLDIKLGLLRGSGIDRAGRILDEEATRQSRAQAALGELQRIAALMADAVNHPESYAADERAALVARYNKIARQTL